MPVETRVRHFSEDGQTLPSESKISYEAYAQLPDGRWYPAKWRTRDQEHRLQVHPGLQVDPRWFEVPEQWRGPHKHKQ